MVFILFSVVYTDTTLYSCVKIVLWKFEKWEFYIMFHLCIWNIYICVIVRVYSHQLTRSGDLILRLRKANEMLIPLQLTIIAQASKKESLRVRFELCSSYRWLASYLL